MPVVIPTLGPAGASLFMPPAILTLLTVILAQSANVTAAEQRKTADAAVAACGESYKAYATLAADVAARRKAVGGRLSMSHQVAVIRLVGAAEAAALEANINRKRATTGMEAAGDVARAMADERLAKANYRWALMFYGFAARGYTEAKAAAEKGPGGYDAARAELKKAVDILCEYK